MLGYVSLVRLTEFRFPVSEIARQLVSALVMGVAVYAGAEYLSYRMVPSLLLIPLGAGLYFGVLIIVSPRFRTTVLSNVPVG